MRLPLGVQDTILPLEELVAVGLLLPLDSRRCVLCRLPDHLSQNSLLVRIVLLRRDLRLLQNFSRRVLEPIYVVWYGIFVHTVDQLPDKL